MTHARLSAIVAVFCSLLAVLPSQAVAQTDALTNDAIVQMMADKVPTATILNRVRTARNAYDVTPKDLVQLQKSRVPAEIISEMLRTSERPKDTLSNQDIIDMVTNQLPERLIVQKILSANSSFDLTTPGLSTLRENKVPASLVSVMMRATPAAAVAGVIIPPTVVPLDTLPPNVVTPSTVPLEMLPMQTVTPSTIPMNSGGNIPAPLTTVLPVVLPMDTTQPVVINNALTITPGGTITSPAPHVVGDGEIATLRIRIAPALAVARIKDYLTSKLITFTAAADNRIVSDWYRERGCGRGVQLCSNRAIVGVTTEGADSVVAVQVFERTRQGGIDATPWKTNLDSRGREAAEMAAELEAALAVAK